MGFTIQVGETRTVLDQNSATIPSASQPGMPYRADQIATMHDLGGIVVCTGNAIGVVSSGLHGGGSVVLHDITVVAAPFDWSLGAPI